MTDLIIKQDIPAGAWSIDDGQDQQVTLDCTIATDPPKQPDPPPTDPPSDPGAPSDPPSGPPPTDPPADPPPSDSAPPPALPLPPFVQPPNGDGPHEVVATVTDADGVAWSATAHVGDDPTQPAVFQRLTDAAGDFHDGLTLHAYADGCVVGARYCGGVYDHMGCKLTVTRDGVECPHAPPTNPDGTLDFWRGCAMPTIRYGTQVGWSADRIDWSILPNYARGGSFVYSDSGYDYSFNGLGCASTTGMSNAGERPDIGFLPQWDVAFLANPCDATWQVVRAAADHCGVWKQIAFCGQDGKIIDCATYPWANTLAPAQRPPDGYGVNPIAPYGGTARGATITPPATVWETGVCPNVPNGAHTTGYAFLAAMITGAAIDKDAASYWANMALLDEGPQYTHALPGAAGFVTEQLRGWAWTLRSFFLASFVSSDTAYFKSWLDQQLPIAMSSTDTTPRHMQGTGAIGYAGANGAAGDWGFALWQQAYLCLTLGAVVNKLPEWVEYAQRMVEVFCTWHTTQAWPFSVEYVYIVSDAANQFSDWPFDQTVKLSLMNLGISDTDAQFVLDATDESTAYNVKKKYFPTWTGQLVDGNCDFTAAMASDSGYVATHTIAIALALDVGADGADVAWQHIQNTPTKIDFTNAPKYHVLPRSEPPDAP